MGFSEMLLLTGAGCFLLWLRHSRRARERDFRALVENSPDHVSRHDLQGRYLYINPTLQQRIGRSIGDVVGKTMTEIWPGQPAQVVEQTIQAVCRLGQTLSLEHVLPRCSERPEYLSLIFVPEFNASGDVSSVLCVGRDITALKVAEQSLEESYSQLRELAAGQEATREEERRRIAHELHDELGQILTAIRLETSMLTFQRHRSGLPLSKRVAHIVSLVDRAIGGVRNVVTLLRPTALERGIVNALVWLTDEFETRTDIRCLLEIDDELPPPDEALSVTLFRIVQESLTNVARHAQADEVHVSLRREELVYRLTVSDNGRGFDPSASARRSLGLRGIRERVRSLNGRIVIDSAPDAGTHLDILIPVSA